MTLPSVAVLGGGAAGVTAAAHLARSGQWRVELFEASDHLGGLHHSPLADGIAYDIGVFLFSRDHEYLRTFPGLADLLVPARFRPVALRASGRMDAYPFSIQGYVRDYGYPRFFLDLADLLGCKWSSRRRDTFRRFCTYYLGNGIYERTGLRAYAERLYELPDREIGLELARSRLQAVAEQCSLRRNALQILGHWAARRDPPGQLALVRPAAGFQVMYEHIARDLERAGVRLRLRSAIRRVERSKSGFCLDLGEGSAEFDKVLSTIPVDSAAQLVGVSLPFVPPTMQLVSLFYRFRGDTGFDGECLFNYSFGGDWKRLTLFSHYHGTVDGDDYFTVECTARDTEVVDLEARRRAFEAHIAGWPVLRGRLDYRGGAVTPRAYPVFRVGEEHLVKESRRQLEATGITLAGRQGRFEYLSSADVASRSRAVAEHMSGRGA